MPRTEDLYWAAGLLEGEGCFYISPPHRGCKVSTIVEMTDYDVVLKLATILQLGFIREKARKTVNGKTTYRWLASGTQAMEVMYTVYPLMGSRRQEKIQECALRWRSVGRKPWVYQPRQAKS